MNKLTVFSILASAATAASAFAPEDASRAERFADPPASARILPIHHGRPNDIARADRELANIVNEGFGGLVANVSFTAYLKSPEAWKTYRHLVDKAHEMGLAQWMYDEKGYPSCTAGGQTLEGHPEWRARAYLIAVTNVPVGSAALPPSPPGRPVRTLRRPSPDGKTETVYVVTDDYIREGTHVSVSVSRWKYDYPNLLMREPTDKFIELTHDAYLRELGPSLKYITSTFTDEPSLMTFWMRPMPYLCLPVSDELLSAYERAAGHPLAEDVPDLVTGNAVGAVAEKRHRFWSMVGERVARNYTGRLTEWADKHGILSGGHLLAEESLVGHVTLYGDFFRVLRGLSAPSCDMLTSIPSTVRWVTPLLVGSAGELNGSRRVMSESSDHSQKYRGEGDKRPTYQVSEREIVGSINRQIWGGVNTFTSYYRWGPFSVEQKRAINMEVGRTVTLMSEGRTAADIALLYPADSLMVGFEPKNRGAGGRAANRTAGLVQTAGGAMFNAGRAFMFVDADSIAEARVEGGRLVRGPLAWRTVVLPGVSTLPIAAARKLAEFRAAGGLVVALGERPVNSESAFPDAEVTRLAKDWVFLSGECPFLAEFLEARHAPALRRVRGEEGVLRTAQRRTASGDVFFVLNDGPDQWRGAVSLAGNPAARVWDPRTGKVVEARGEIALDLPPFGAVLVTTEVPVDGRILPGSEASFSPRLVPFALEPEAVKLGKGQYVSGGDEARPEGWRRVDVTLTKGAVDTFAFLSRKYAQSPFQAGAKGVGCKIRVPVAGSGSPLVGVFLVTADGSLWYAHTSVPLSVAGEAEVAIALSQFAPHGRGKHTAKLHLEDVRRVNIGFGGYFGFEGEHIVFEVSPPCSLVLE